MYAPPNTHVWANTCREQEKQSISEGLKEWRTERELEKKMEKLNQRKSELAWILYNDTNGFGIECKCGDNTQRLAFNLCAMGTVWIYGAKVLFMLHSITLYPIFLQKFRIKKNCGHEYTPYDSVQNRRRFKLVLKISNE